MKIYFISGLGADKRVFQFLELGNNFSHEIIYLDWIEPIRNESISNYCRRLSKEIDTKSPFMLVGLSFGGIIAIELSKIINPERVILISSIASRLELPSYFKIAAKLRINKVIPGIFYQRTNYIAYKIFGISTMREKKLLDLIIQESSIVFSKWAIDKILNWRNTYSINNLIRIHGNKDRLFPIKMDKINHVIVDGGHLMIVSKAKEISEILNKELL